MAYLVVLAESALQCAPCEEYSAASPFSGDRRLFSMMKRSTGYPHSTGLFTEAKLSGSPVHTAGTGTECAFFIIHNFIVIDKKEKSM